MTAAMCEATTMSRLFSSPLVTVFRSRPAARPPRGAPRIETARQVEDGFVDEAADPRHGANDRVGETIGGAARGAVPQDRRQTPPRADPLETGRRRPERRWPLRFADSAEQRAIPEDRSDREEFPHRRRIEFGVRGARERQRRRRDDFRAADRRCEGVARPMRSVANAARPSRTAARKKGPSNVAAAVSKAGPPVNSP
jgi:hypothetical protein